MLLRRLWTAPYRLPLMTLVIGLVAPLCVELFLWLLDLGQRGLLAGMAGYQSPSVDSVVAGAYWPEGGRVWAIPLATGLGGLLSGILIYRFAPEAEGHGTDAMIRAYHDQGGAMRARVPLVKAVASALTIGSGGAAGREGPVVQIMAGIGSVLAQRLGLSAEERRQLMLIATAAGLSAVFRSPLGSALFAVTVLYSGLTLESAVIGHAILAAATAYAVIGLFEGWAPLFSLPPGLALETPAHLFWFILLGALAGLVGALLPSVFYGIRDGFRRLAVPQILKPALGGLALGLLAIPLPQVLGGGYDWIQFAIDGQLPLTLLISLVFAKMLALGLTVGSGGAGGVFAPALYVGVMLGAAVASCACPLFSSAPEPAALAVVGMAALFGSTARVPLAALLMVIEMTGGYGLVVPAMVAIITGLVLQDQVARRMPYRTLYEAQVPTPADSPVHQHEYCSSMFRLLREQQAKLPKEIVVAQETRLLLEGEPLPLPDGEDVLWLAEVGKDATVEGKTVASLPADITVLSILRGEHTLFPDPERRLQAADRLLLTFRKTFLDQARQLFAAGGRRRT